MCTYRKIVSSLEHSSQMQQSSKEVAEDSTSSQPQLSTPATVECEDVAECWIINLQLLGKHKEDVTQHVATCSTCLQSTVVITVVGEKHCNWLASIIGSKFNGYEQELTFATSTKISSLTGKFHWTHNLAAVWGQMTVGVPVMTKQYFIDTEQVIGKRWWTALEEWMLAAGKEEKQLTTKMAVPSGYTSYYSHCQWRAVCTHKHSYNALSGVGQSLEKITIHRCLKYILLSLCKREQ